MQRVLSISRPQMKTQRDDLVATLSPVELLRAVFGCWHRRMSWPLTRDGQTYRGCLKCGARRRFDVKTWKTYGSFYRRD